MKPSIDAILMVSGLVLAASSPIAMSADESTSSPAAATTGSDKDYKAQYDECKKHTDSDKNLCRDLVGMGEAPSADRRTPSLAGPTQPQEPSQPQNK